MVKKIFVTMLVVCLLISGIFLPFSANALSFNIDFDTSSNAICLVNLDTDTIVYSKNADAHVEPASVTKIMTYIITVSNVKDLDGTMVTVSDDIISKLEGTDSSLSNIEVGETLSVTELLNCLMIPSGNDAAMVLANYVGNGNIDYFVELMNQKASELGCSNTHFMNPTGLHNSDHYTSANDMAKIARYAMELPKFMEIVSQTKHIIPATNKQEERVLINTNKMMQPYEEDYYYKYTKGIKTGWHDEAGYCIVTSATADGYTYLCVAMGAPSEDANGNDLPNGAMLDSKKLYRWAFTTFELKSIVDVTKPVKEVKLNLAWGVDTLLLVPEKNVSFLLPKDVEPSSISMDSIDVMEEVNAPVKKGDVIGTAVLSYANQELTTINLVANEDVKRSELLYYLSVFKNIFTSVWFLVTAILFILLFFVYILLSNMYNKKNNKKVKKYRNL